MGQNNYWCCYFWADSISYVGIAMSTWKINLKEQTATSVKERYHLQSQKLTSEWMEGHGGIEAERKLINGVKEENKWER